MNKEIAKIFREMAELLDVRGDNAFHINAYIKTAEYLESLLQYAFSGRFAKAVTLAFSNP